MAISASMLPEFDHEMANTRRTLERIPDDRADYKPHEKSGTLIWLAIHLATMPEWIVPTIKQDQFDYAPPGAPPYSPPPLRMRAEVLEVFDRNVAAGRAALAEASDETMLAPWSLLAGGKTLFTMPRVAVIRSMIMNHSIHHRAQLTVYLRLNNVPVPALYGPSADESGM